ncbi:mitochondrial ribosomal protein S25-domain-containing protein [Butyriboletus roseoflavus]|nr:mitochondrial ribosomal protein S25-domain-containing protein [Butyriboletus roseoflavus]
MVRRIASQVHKQVSRLMQANYIRGEPVWYQAVLQYPPLPLPSRAPPFQALEAENPSRRPTASSLRPQKMKPLAIKYLEDRLRLQIFRDHPFEAFRPVSIVEGQLVEPEHPNPTAEEYATLFSLFCAPLIPVSSAVLFAANLHRHHKLSLTVAYTRAVAEFRALRAEYDIANTFARMEAESYGTVYPSEIDRTFEKEDKVYKSAERKKALDESALRARKRWRAILNLDSGMGNTWSRGQEYIKRQKDGVRPSHLGDDQIKPRSSPSEEQLFGS